MTNPQLDRLTDYPFARLRALLDGVAPAAGRDVLAMSVGEPQHAVPPLVEEVLAREAAAWNRYPPMEGTAALRGACVGWLDRRFGLPDGTVDVDAGVLPLSGTREGLFQVALAAVPRRKDGRRPAVLMPNPFYAAYEGAAVMAGAEPVFLDCTAETGFLPDLDRLESDPDLLRRTALIYLCSPSNPQGAVADRDYLARILRLARAHGIVLAADECYAEIYDAAPPPGMLEVAAATGAGVEGLLVFHSLSKRSSAAGLRSGFVAGDPRLVALLRRLRSYSCAGLPLPIQAASAALWDDDAHVAENRAAYRAKFDAAERALAGRLPMTRPAGGFFLWLDVGSAFGGDGPAAARAIWADQAVRVLPGAFLTKPSAGSGNAGRPYLRIALVHDAPVVEDALGRIADVLTGPAAAWPDGETLSKTDDPRRAGVGR